MRISIQQILQREKFEDSKQMYKFWAVVAGLSYPAYQIGLNTLISSFIGSNAIDTLIALVIRWGLFGLAVQRISRKKIKACVFFAIIITLYMVISYLVFPVNREDVFDIFKEFFTYGFWGVVYVYMLDTDEELKEALKYVGYITIFSLIFEPFATHTTLFQAANNSWGSSGYLTWGTRYMVGVVILLSLVFHKKCKGWVILLALFSSIELIIIGNRGSIIVISTFLILYVFFEVSSFRKCFVIALIVCLMAALYLFLNSGDMASLVAFLSDHGIQSRTLTKYLDNTLSVSDSGRDYATMKSLEQISNNHYLGNIFGIGIGGDRFLIGKYPHQFFLEILLQFGNLQGSILIIVLVKSLLEALFHADNEAMSILISVGFVQLMYAGTFWSSVWFFFLIGYLFRYKKMSMLT